MNVALGPAAPSGRLQQIERSGGVDGRNPPGDRGRGPSRATAGPPAWTTSSIRPAWEKRPVHGAPRRGRRPPASEKPRMELEQLLRHVPGRGLGPEERFARRSFSRPITSQPRFREAAGRTQTRSVPPETGDDRNHAHGLIAKGHSRRPASTIGPMAANQTREREARARPRARRGGLPSTVSSRWILRSDHPHPPAFTPDCRRLGRVAARAPIASSPTRGRFVVGPRRGRSPFTELTGLRLGMRIESG